GLLVSLIVGVSWNHSRRLPDFHARELAPRLHFLETDSSVLTPIELVQKSATVNTPLGIHSGAP
ncbi:hypothetical protein L915_20517, partial [Phytophthora nicotianae]